MVASFEPLSRKHGKSSVAYHNSPSALGHALLAGFGVYAADDVLWLLRVSGLKLVFQYL